MLAHTAVHEYLATCLLLFNANFQRFIRIFFFFFFFFFPRNIAPNTGAFKAWEDTLISASRTLLEISHSHNQTVMNSLESAYFSAKTKALNTLKDNTSKDNIEKALDRIQTRLDGSLFSIYCKAEGDWKRSLLSHGKKTSHQQTTSAQ